MNTKQMHRLAARDRVRTRVDPRHIGVVQRIFAGPVAEVRWLPHGWVEYIPVEDLIREGGES